MHGNVYLSNLNKTLSITENEWKMLEDKYQKIIK